MHTRIPPKQGLYDPQFEHDSCGVGFVANIKGERSHQILQDAAVMLQNMDHRGACGCEANTGDGAGMLTALPHPLFQALAKEQMGVELPEPGRYAVGNIFLPHDEKQREFCKAQYQKFSEAQGQKLLGWRKVPTDADAAEVGPSARETEPWIEQVFIAAGDDTDAETFERQLYLIRKQAYHAIQQHDEALLNSYYVCSLSTRVIIYKGQLTSGQVMKYYPDLNDERYTSHLAMVHSRFSTNTFPSWDRAQPMRFMSHNGEINTKRGNENWMTARQGVMQSDLFGDELNKALPVIDPTTSDSGTFDNAMELLLLAGRPLPEVVMMMIPEAWQNHESMSPRKRAFYEYHSCLMEPWDGPASISFTDGKYIGAVLDRNGLRPSRYYITQDDRCIMASEVGVLPTEPSNVKEKGRLQPGRMFLIDFEEGRLVPDDEIKSRFASERPYGEWLDAQRIELDELDAKHEPHGFYPDSLIERMRAFGYTTETMQFMLVPLIHAKKDPVGSMGNDAALAVLSDQPRMLYDYFKQHFAQVTNPAIDSIREETIMSLQCYIGPEGNLLEATPEHAHRLLVPHPILTNEQLAAMQHLDYRGWQSKVIDITWPRAEGPSGMRRALDRICNEAEQAIDDGYSLVILSDRNMDAEHVPVSTLLASGAVHHHLVKQHKRTRVGLVLETGEAREVHHHCLLVGYGADAINPYMAFEALWQARRDGIVRTDEFESDEDIVAAYRKGTAKGMLKVMAKMGISTLQSYKGAQIFEAVGLGDEVIERSFVGTATQIKGVGLDVLAEESLRRHALGYPERDAERLAVLPNDGQFHWRAEAEKHALNPQTIADLQQAARHNDGQAYHRFAELVNKDNRNRCTPRGLLRFKHLERKKEAAQNNGEAGSEYAIPLEEVEPASEIVKRFRTGAMSFGSISRETHEGLAVAMNRIGGSSNTGEGGEDSGRFTPDDNGDSRRSSIKQVASGRFGVTSWYLTNADELQIKISQGAKPGEGGELPGFKVDEVIAKLRHSTPGVGLISPPPHHDIYSIEDLKQLIHDLKNSNPSAKVSVKLVSEVGVGTIAAGVSKAHADHILIAGHDGGTGASPLTSIKHAGLPWELGLAETHQTLVLNGLRSRSSIETDGQLKTGRDIVIATMLGAESYGFSTAPLVTMGCIMMRKCHLNTCPVGIATQDPELRKKFHGLPDHVVNYFFMVAEEAREWMAKMGFRSINDMIGRCDMLEQTDAVDHWKANGLDLSPLLHLVHDPATQQQQVYKTIEQDHEMDGALDYWLVEQAQPAIQNGEKVNIETPVKNTDRVVGTILSHEISKAWGEFGFPDNDTVRIKLNGSAGQSVGAWLQRGVTIELEGDANDYVGKGLCGGHIHIYPPKDSAFAAEDNIIIGNVALYGATGGYAFFRGMAAERFCVRNSGAHTVVEGVGDHGCEYMTGGRAVILGPTGRNFAAGMSGGVAYVWDQGGDFITRCNLGMVELEQMTDPQDIDELRELIEAHRDATGSPVAAGILDRWPEAAREFTKVMPTDLKRVLAERQAHEEEQDAPVHDGSQGNGHPKNGANEQVKEQKGK
jgi:glutamate synthase (NADPH/NADH) large chain